MRNRAFGRICCALLFGTITLGGAPAGALAHAADESWAQPTTPVASESETFAYDNRLPARYDLRDVPGALQHVRYQNPWGTCWAFGAIAAAETSINARYGAGLDLSERHLAWFGLTPVAAVDDPVQQGEGVYVFGADDYYRKNKNAIFNRGGVVTNSSTLFASGAGPVTEAAFPSRGKEGRTDYDIMVQDPKSWKDEFHAELLAKYGSDQKTVEAFRVEYPDLTDIGDLLQRRWQETVDNMRSGASPNQWSPEDDWTVSATDEKGASNRNKSAGYVLEKSNSMQWFCNYDEKTHRTTLNEDGMQAVKQEILDGHGIVVTVAIDDTSTDEETGHSSFTNTQKWCQYVYDPGYVNAHTVSIVGWDDNYPAQNFAGTLTMDGKVVQKPAPPGPGAWIIRNSWGMKDGCDRPLMPGIPLIGRNNYGIDGSGYIYVSYYDVSLMDGESFEFSRNLDNGTSFYVNQYDYLPGSPDGFSISDEKVISSANVFSAEADQRIVSVSSRTGYTNAEITYAIFLLSEGAKDPTDGELVTSFTVTCGYPGYYRHDLPEPITVERGERFSVVATKSVVDNGIRYYEVNATSQQNLQVAKQQHDDFLKENEERVKRGEQPYDDTGTTYGVAVVNPGESFIYAADGSWHDWLDYVATPEVKRLLPKDVIDNFCIKAFSTGLGAEDRDHAYRCTGGTRTLTRGTGELACTFCCTEPDRDAYDHFVSVALDGRTLLAADYDLAHLREAGQVRVTLSLGLLSSLATGAHTLTASFDDGDPVSFAFTLTEPHASPDAGEGGQAPTGDGRPVFVDDSDDDAYYYDYYEPHSRGTHHSSAGTTTASVAMERIAGDGRYETMAATVAKGFETCDVVVVASGEAYADALSASALAGAHAAPVVLTESGRLSTSARTEIARLGARRTIVCGGPASVSDEVVDALQDLTGKVERIFGADRQSTSVRAFLEARATRSTSDTVVVSGDLFADALSIGPWAWKTASPVMLTRAGVLSDEAVSAIKADPAIRRVVIVGGPSSVSEEVRGQLGDAYTYERLGGADRYETSSLVARWACTGQLGWEHPLVATGKGFADALSGVSLAGTLSSPILLVDGASDATVRALRENKDSMRSVILLGGEAAVSANTEQALREALS